MAVLAAVFGLILPRHKAFLFFTIKWRRLRGLMQVVCLIHLFEKLSFVQCGDVVVVGHVSKLTMLKSFHAKTFLGPISEVLKLLTFMLPALNSAVADIRLVNPNLC